jgi:hypothetical protein
VMTPAMMDLSTPRLRERGRNTGKIQKGTFICQSDEGRVWSSRWIWANLGGGGRVGYFAPGTHGSKLVRLLTPCLPNLCKPRCQASNLLN